MRLKRQYFKRKVNDNMTTEIIVALITLVGTLIGTFSGIVVGTKLINYRIEQLEKKVDKAAFSFIIKSKYSSLEYCTS